LVMHSMIHLRPGRNTERRAGVICEDRPQFKTLRDAPWKMQRPCGDLVPLA
jgi:hypothetical protein